MSLGNCFPEWLQRRTAQRIGPGFEDAIPYPTFTVQPAIIDANNPNSRAANITDAFFQSVTSRLAGGAHPNVIDTSIIHVMPNNVYDTILVYAMDLTAGGVAVPIFMSMDEPGRIISEVPIQGSQEAHLATANAFDPNDVSSYPNCVFSGQPSPVTYSNASFATSRTNRPFYIWFGDSLATAPGAAGIGFKISWFTQGR